MSPASDQHYDVAVIGSGVAGASAAWHLARAGLRVAVFEKARLPRYKTCGGGVLPRAREQLPFDIAECTERECNSVALGFEHSGLKYRIQREHPMIYMTMRSELDQRILSAALEAGAALHVPCTLKDVSQTVGRVNLHCDAGEFSANFVIGCDGAGSQVAKRSGWTERLPMTPACEWEVRLPAEEMDRFRDTARFDFDVVRNGYAWVFPKAEHLSIGAGAFGAGKFPGHKLVASYLEHLGVQRTEGIERHGYVIPHRPRSEFFRRRVLLAGDAAGLIDPVTGEGITYALTSGRLAADALIATDCDPVRAGREYTARLRQDILPEIRTARWLAWTLYERPGVSRWLLRHYGPVLAASMIRVIVGEKSYRELLSAPGNYLRLLLRRSSPERSGVKVARG